MNRRLSEKRGEHKRGKERIYSTDRSTEVYNVLQATPHLAEVIAPIFNSDESMDKYIKEHKYELAGIAKEFLRFGAEIGSPEYALLGAQIYEKLGKGDRPYVLDHLKKSLQNIHHWKERENDHLNLFGPGYKDVHNFNDKTSYRIEEKTINDVRNYLKEKGKKSLEHKVTAGILLSLASILLSLFFFSKNITGFAIVNNPIARSNLWGVLLFLFGVIGLFIFIRKK